MLSAPRPPQPPGPRQASRPSHVQMSRGIPSSWCSRRSIPVWSNICFLCWHATCWACSELRGQHGQGMGEGTLPSYPRILAGTLKLGDSPRNPQKNRALALGKNILSIFLKRKLQNEIREISWDVFLSLLNSIRLQVSSGQLTGNLENTWTLGDPKNVLMTLKFSPFVMQLNYF